ncbi:MAG TPA: type II secretion system protein GspL [Casimicrobiaceae bacterium]|nr:type II secretion system protein GspL [Casimicrobiaceae bacterium]
MAETPTTLRVFIDDPPDAGRDAAWSVFDAAGRAVRNGRDKPAAWPAAARREAVIAARHGRLVTLTLPPLPPGRAEAAAQFALEDQLADAPADSHIAIAAQRGDGDMRVAIVARGWMSAFAAASQRCGVSWDRAVLESDLAPAPARSWRWCAASIAQPGFVRTDRGATIAVGPAQGDAPPAELALALARGGVHAPRAVRVDASGASPALLERARAITGVEFVAGTPWHWVDASPAVFAGAIDLLSGRYDTEATRPAVGLRRLLRPALWIAAIAIGLHVAATVGNWLWLRWESAAIDRELVALARSVVPEFAQGSAAETSPTAALARRERDLKHRAGLAALDDFLPLLARAAPALAALPAGAIRSLSYADGHLLLDLQKIEPAEPSRLQRELQKVGLIAIAAPTASGARLRVGLN